MTAVITAGGIAARHTTDYLIRSTAMSCMNEALARDRMREAEQRARQASLAREVVAARRWRRVSSYARAAESRHAARVARVPGVAASR